jgi:hypothetical protein
MRYVRRFTVKLVPRGGAVGIAAAVVAMSLTTTGAGAKSGGPVTAFGPQSNGTYDYGIVPIGSHSDQTFTLTNTGGTATAALSVSLKGSSAFTRVADTCSSASLGPAKRCTITVRYLPTAATLATATLTATSVKPAATASVTLNGTGGFVDVAISPSTYDFGSASGSQAFTATNNGNIPTAAYTFGAPTDEHFGVTGSNTCTGAALAPGGSCSFTVAFTPPTCAAEPALYLDSVSLGGYASVAIKGEQPQCRPHLTLAAYDPPGKSGIGGWTFDGDSGTQVFSLTNDGKATTGTLAFTFGGQAPNEEPGPWLSADLGSCQSTATLAVGASCTFTVTWDDTDHSLCQLFPNDDVEDIGVVFVTDAAFDDDWHQYRFQGNCPGIS